jgi:hypothetical protein
VTPLAHGGGVPEALTVLVPLVAVVIFLRLGAKRVPSGEEPPEPAAPAEPPDDGQQAT